MRGLVLIGTGTDVGKTYVTQLIARQLVSEQVRCGIYKPVCSGAERDDAGTPVWHDIETHFAALEGRFPRSRICPQAFLAPAAPPVAARAEGTRVDSERFRSGIRDWIPDADLLLVEGAGGLLSPLSDAETIVELIAEFRLPALLVANFALGEINATRLTLEVAQQRGLTIRGIILNEVKPGRSTVAAQTLPDELRRCTEVPLLSIVDWNQTNWLRRIETGRTIDWTALAGGDFSGPPAENRE